MITTRLTRLSALFLIVVPIVFTACFAWLQVLFEYPDILRQPSAEVLTKFQAGGSGLIATWYVLTLSAVLFIPLVLLLHSVLAGERDSLVLRVATVFGVVAGVVQTLGFLRWPFLVPYLAQIALDPDSSVAERGAATVVFESFNRYAGMAVGEHFGYIATSVWTVLITIVLLQTGRVTRWIAAAGLPLAAGVAAGLLEPAGWAPAGAINAISYLVWAVWLVVLGVRLLIRPASAKVNLRPSTVTP